MIAALMVLALAGAPAAEAREDAKAEVVVDLNKASLTELCTLPGIGPKKAEAILLLRSKRPFTRVTQLLQVKGIGPKTLDKLKAHVVISPVKEPPKPPTQKQPELAPIVAPSATAPAAP